MRFDQTRDILQFQVAEYHRAVGRLYQVFAKQEISPRNLLMLEYLIDHELRLALAIDDFMAEAPPSALDYWFKRIEIPFPVPAAGILTDSSRTDLNQLVGTAVHYKTALIEFYDHLLQQCDAEETAKLFQAIRDQEDKGMKRFIRHAQGLEDL